MPEGAAAFAASGLVTVTPTTTPGVFALAAAEEDRCCDRRCSHCEGVPKTPISCVMWMMGYAGDPCVVVAAHRTR